MKTGNKFAKHLISGIKGSAEMKHPRPGVSPNTSVRGILLQCVFKLYIVSERIYIIKFSRERNSHLFLWRRRWKCWRGSVLNAQKKNLDKTAFSMQTTPSSAKVTKCFQVGGVNWRHQPPVPALLHYANIPLSTNKASLLSSPLDVLRKLCKSNCTNVTRDSIRILYVSYMAAKVM